MGKFSKNKGRRGELEFSKVCHEHGHLGVRRGQQFCGASGDADVIGLPGIHVEVKRTEKLSLYPAMSQAKGDAKPGLLPVVAHKRNHAEWLIVMRAEDFFTLYNNSDVGDDE